MAGRRAGGRRDALAISVENAHDTQTGRGRTESVLGRVRRFIQDTYHASRAGRLNVIPSMFGSLRVHFLVVVGEIGRTGEDHLAAEVSRWSCLCSCLVWL